MKNKISIFLLIIAIAIPRVASAAWWNPLTWFNEDIEISEPITPIEKELNKSETKNDVTSSNSGNINTDKFNETKIIEKEVIREVPIEKIVEKVITTTDQSVVNENNQLKTKIKELENEVAKLKKEGDLTETKKKELIAEINNIESAVNKVLVFGIYCYQPLSSTKSLSCESGLSENRRNERALELEAKKSSLLLDLNKLGGISGLNTTQPVDTQSIIKTAEDRQKQKERDFFNDLLFRSDYRGDAENRLCYTWSYSIHLEVLDEICKGIKEGN